MMERRVLMAEKKVKQGGKPGRPRNPVVNDTPVNETADVLMMSERAPGERGEHTYTIDEINAQWKRVYGNFSTVRGSGILSTVMDKWNQLNPFLQNQRIKNLYTQAKTYGKADISSFLMDPANSETQLRSLSWANSSSQQIYYNILRRSCDIPLYNYFVIPDLLDSDDAYGKGDFSAEDLFVHEWLETFDVKNTFKTIAMEVKREGKASYLFRNRVIGSGNSRIPDYCTLQKMPTDWIKITGKGQLGYTISFNMMYFLNIANSPEFFGDFIKKAWADMVDKGIVHQPKPNGNYEFSPERFMGVDGDGNVREYSFSYDGISYHPSIELRSTGFGRGRQTSYLFWLQLPFDMCYTFGSDNSHPWMAPDTMGLMLKMQELTDYLQLAGLIASTPLTAVITGEIEPISGARALKNESVFSPELIQGLQDKFNAITSTNVEAFMWPAKNIKLQQLSSDVNSSEIISTATSNFLESAGEGGLTIATEKPNVAQINVAKKLAASQQHYVTLQFERVLNYILRHKLGLKYRWKVRLWGDIFSQDDELKFLKEIVANGNIALLPKLMSAEGMSMRDTSAMTKYIKELGFYEDFMTYTQLKNAELQEASTEDDGDDAGSGEGATKKVGRPEISENDIDNDATASSRDNGTNTSDNRES